MSTLAKTTSETAEQAQRVEFITPRVNLHHDGDSYTLEVEMPGVSKQGVEVTVDDGKLTLVGHRSAGPEAGRKVYTERSRASYRRVFDLDPSIDPGKINAQIEQGLLTVQLRKAEAAKPRKITVG